jgi:N-methylhydantoinase A
MAVGGAGPLHAADLADLLGIATIIVPRDPGFAAAAGLFVADMREDLAQACPQKESALDPMQLTHIMTELEQQAQIVLAEEGIPATSRRLIRSVDFHYLDMSTQLTIDLPEGALTSDILQRAIEQFHGKHERLYGFAFRLRRKVMLTTLRMTVIGIRPKPSLPAQIPRGGDTILPKAKRAVFFFAPNHFVDCPVYDRTVLGAGTSLNGPAIIEQYDSTTLIPPHFHAYVDMFGNLILKRTVSGYNTAA